MFESRRHLRNCPFLWLLPPILLDFFFNRSNERTAICIIILLITILQWLRNDSFYYFTDEVFIAKGVFKFYKIPLKSIKKIEIKKNIILKNSKVLERYVITFDNHKITVTPKDMTSFLQAINEKTGISLS
jgi:hypothetical protein